jgi:hypothetical protein
MSNKTLAEASKEANELRHDYSDLDIEIARQVNRLALLMNGDRTAAAMALVSHELWKLHQREWR